MNIMDVELEFEYHNRSSNISRLLNQIENELNNYDFDKTVDELFK